EVRVGGDDGGGDPHPVEGVDGGADLHPGAGLVAPGDEDAVAAVEAAGRAGARAVVVLDGDAARVDRPLAEHVDRTARAEPVPEDAAGRDDRGGRADGEQTEAAQVL